MPLLEFLPTDGVMTGLSASSKKQLIENIAEHAGSLTGLSARAVFDALMQRERLGSPLLGSIVDCRFLKSQTFRYSCTEINNQ